MPNTNTGKNKYCNDWISFKKNFSNVLSPVLELAQTLNKTEQRSIKVDEFAYNPIDKKAFDKRILVENNGSLSFSNDFYLLFALTEYLIQKQILPIWDFGSDLDILNLISEANRKHLRTTNKNELTQQVLFVLNEDYEKNITQFVGRQAQHSHKFWSVFSPFTKILPEIDFKTEDLIGALVHIQKEIQGNLASGSIHTSLEEIGKKRSQKGKEIYSQLVSQKDPNLVYFIPNILKGLSINDFPQVYSRAFKLARSKNINLQIGGILTLGVLNYEARDEEVAQTLNFLESCEGTEDEEKTSVIVRSYHNLLEGGIETGDGILRISYSNFSLAQFRVSHCLFCTQDKYGSKSWFKSALINLSTTKLKDVRTTDNIDHLLRKYIEDDLTFVIQFFEEWIRNREYLNVNREEQITDIFQSTFAELKNASPEGCEKIITNWFNSDDAKFHTAASHVVHSYSMFSDDQNPIKLSLNKEILDRIEPSEVRFIALKVMGYVLDGYPLCSLIFSILQRSPEDEELNAFVIEAFTSYIAYNYPKREEDFLKERAENGNPVEQKVAQQILDKMSAYHQERENLPELKELKPPTERLHALGKLRFKQQEEIREKVNKRSIFSQIVTNIPIKYGRSMFTYHDGEVTERSYMGQYSHSMELPRGEFIDPLGQHFLRYIWRLQEKEDVE